MFKRPAPDVALRIGYARDLFDYDLARQRDDLARRCDHLFFDNGEQQQQLAQCLTALQANDVFIVCRFDSLARTTAQFLEVLANLLARGVHFESLVDEVATATSSDFARLLTALAALNQSTVRRRTQKGLAAARGRAGGRKPKVTPATKAQMRAAYDAKEMSVADICRRWRITRSTFYRAVLDRDYNTREAIA